MEKVFGATDNQKQSEENFLSSNLMIFVLKIREAKCVLNKTDS